MKFEKSDFEKNLEIGNKIVDLAMGVFKDLRSGMCEVERIKLNKGIELGYSIKQGNASKGISSVATIFNNTNKNTVPKERKKLRTDRIDNNEDLKCLDGDFVRILNHPENKTIEMADVIHKKKKIFTYGDAQRLAEEMSNILGITINEVMERDLNRLFFDYNLMGIAEKQNKKKSNKKSSKK